MFAMSQETNSATLIQNSAESVVHFYEQKKCLETENDDGWNKSFITESQCLKRVADTWQIFGLENRRKRRQIINEW